MAATMQSPAPMLRVSPLVSGAKRPMRVLLGAWSLLYEGVAGVVRDPDTALDRIERRGLKVEREMERTLRHLESRGNLELKRLSTNARHPVRWAQESLSETSQIAESELERQVERVLLRMGIPTRDRLERLSREIELLSKRIDEELLQLTAEPENA